MKKSLAVFYSLFFITIANPAIADTHDGTIYIDGAINDTTCTVAPDSKDFSVAMGKVSTKQFSQAGKGSGYVPFTIGLEKCGAAASGVTVHFEGTADMKNQDLLSIDTATGSATGVGVGLYNQDKSFIPYGKESTKFSLTPNQASATLNFYARYIANGDSIVPGAANATATFILTYA